MSLVGTRPPTVDEWDKYELHHRARLATKPGLTGMWQVSGRSNITDLPFTFLLMWTAKEKLLKAKGRQICFTSILWYSTKVTFLFSLTIEFLQLFLRLGTFQLSDLCYNTLGGAMGVSYIYPILWRFGLIRVPEAIEKKMGKQR